jgi:hypothetical protein
MLQEKGHLWYKGPFQGARVPVELSGWEEDREDKYLSGLS